MLVAPIGIAALKLSGLRILLAWGQRQPRAQVSYQDLALLQDGRVNELAVLATAQPIWAPGLTDLDCGAVALPGRLVSLAGTVSLTGAQSLGHAHTSPVDRKAHRVAPFSG